ncbi:hypothetical protein [uncultured Cellulomonas sp.]|uniref:hypothetical protein n=1 Tax=uncultured Cellulomonas sp. TaxID=189682 RepID=UPI002601930C|nr:hypothetical protein [uncultured Cellulomonas sp.]
MVQTGSTVSPVTTPPSAPRGRTPLVLALVGSALVGAAVATALILGLGLGVAGGGGAPVAEDAQRAAEAAEPEIDTTKLAWAPPELEDPTTIEVKEGNREFHLDRDKDYVLEMPDEPLDVRGGLVVNGGRNVVVIGGEIRITRSGDRAQEIRGLYFRGQEGTVHAEGLLITGDELGEGINLDQRRGAMVQLQNIRVETVHGEKEGQHADVLQTWAGPAELRVDKLTGYTTYQGLFLLPRQFTDEDPERFDLRRVNIRGADDAAYMLWRDGEDWPIDVQDVWVAPAEEDNRTEDDDVEAFVWSGREGAGSWEDVQVGVPPGGDFVKAEDVGLGYESPGYLEDAEQPEG